jgi:hypothetical protein
MYLQDKYGGVGDEVSEQVPVSVRLSLYARFNLLSQGVIANTARIQIWRLLELVG